MSPFNPAFVGRFNRPTLFRERALLLLLLGSGLGSFRGSFRGSIFVFFLSLESPKRFCVALIVSLMVEVNAFVAVSADGIDKSGMEGTGTEPPVKKDPIAKNR